MYQFTFFFFFCLPKIFGFEQKIGKGGGVNELVDPGKKLNPRL